MANQLPSMSEYCREQHPLLCEEASEEEAFSPRYYQRIRPMSYRGRAKNNLKGAAAILARWPDHWSSFLTYWWIGIGMISLTTFIIYNSLFAFSMLSAANVKPATPNPIMHNRNEKTSSRRSLLPEIYMHVFARQNEDIDLNKYLPYIEITSNAFLDYTFNFIVVINDTNFDWISAEENNEIALNMLWTKEKNKFEKRNHNKKVNIQHVTISSYLDNSPLRKYWRTLPHQLIEFLVRAVSIWEKGGIAFNPDILTPKFQHTLYIEKLQKLLNKYDHTNIRINISNYMKKLNKTQKKVKKLNNIRDIIDALESEDMSVNAFSQQSLAEAEDRAVILRHEGLATSIMDSKDAMVEEKINAELNSYDVDRILGSKPNTFISNDESTIPDIIHNSTKMNLLPMFLEYLFNNKKDITIPNPTQKVVTNRTRKRAITPSISKEDGLLSKNVLRDIAKDTINMIDPVIISTATIYNKSEHAINELPTKEIVEDLETKRLTIDLKGHIIATDTPCHAFLGTVFSNAVHHREEETITDFIISELSIFCKGLLSSCTGIDLILL